MNVCLLRPAHWIAVILTVGFAGISAPARAQSVDGPSLSFGYQALHLPDNWINAGFSFDLTAPATDQMAIVTEFGISYQGSGGSDPVSSNTAHFGAGPRWSWPRGRVVPFAQVLFGAEVSSAEIPAGGSTFEDSDLAFMLQPGAGIYLPLSERGGVVAQADYRPVFIPDSTDNQFRIVVGVRMALGN